MTPQTTKPIVLILGPTAGGKTELAIELARRLPGSGECISADSMQVYRGLDIGTAKPTPAQRRAVAHHLIDLVDPCDDAFSVDTWLDLADHTIAEIRRRGRWPIVVGGTNLYVQALLRGLLEGPAPDPVLRAKLQELDGPELRRRLERADPEAARRIHPHDRRRTIRALEVHGRLGKPLSELQTQWGGTVRPDAVIVGLMYPVQTINRRINRRVRAMIEAGLVGEVQRLARAGVLGVQAAQALGYRQLLDHLEGRLTLEEAIEQIKIRTRRFAKQQRTWLRRFRSVPDSIWLEATDEDAQTLAEKALVEILSWQDRRPVATAQRRGAPPRPG
jgi:tRNA dimethylallyltransferase